MVSDSWNRSTLGFPYLFIVGWTEVVQINETVFKYRFSENIINVMFINFFIYGLQKIKDIAASFRFPRNFIFWQAILNWVHVFAVHVLYVSTNNFN